MQREPALRALNDYVVGVGGNDFTGPLGPIRGTYVLVLSCGLPPGHVRAVQGGGTARRSLNELAIGLRLAGTAPYCTWQVNLIAAILSSIFLL